MKNGLRIGAAIAIAIGFASLVRAQGYTDSTTDGLVAPAIAPGNPASSYALSGIDHVNMYNGNLNISIPLVHIGGRGSAGYTMTYSADTQWRVEKIYIPISGTSWLAVPNSGGTAPVPFSPGVVVVRYASVQPSACEGSGGSWFDLGPYVTRVVWIRTDGTESVLLDSNYGGQPEGPTTCEVNYQPVNRGTVFKSVDGSDLTFVAASNISDYPAEGDGSVGGTLYFPDGTKYTVGSNGNITQIEDRNGNLVTLTYPSSGPLLSVVDPLNRTTTVTYDSSSQQYKINYHGFNGAARSITISSGPLASNLASGQSTQTAACLFPELPAGSGAVIGSVTSSIELADGTYYTFQYNSYGEVSRLVLPTGAVYGYVMPEANCNANGSSGVIGISQYTTYSIHRPISERDEYAAGGTTLTAKATFSYSYKSSDIDPNHSARPGTTTTVTRYDGSGNKLRVEQHLFYGDPASAASIPTDPTQYPDWSEGLEFQSVIENPPTTTLLTSQKVWDQRPCESGEVCWLGGNGATSVNSDAAPAHDPQMCQVNTVLDSGQTSGLAYLFDQYNNVSDQYEFDYASAPAIGASCPTSFSNSNYTRHTNTLYVATSSYTGQPVYILSLPSQVTVDGVGGTVAKTQYAYDQTAVASESSIVGHDSGHGASFTTRGNPTTVSQCLNPSSCTWLKTTQAFDIAGNVVSTTDANNHTTTVGYADSEDTYAHPTTVTNALNQGASMQYDYWTGNLTQYTDANGVSTTYGYGVAPIYDPLERLTTVAQAAGTSAEADTTYSYSLTTSPPQVSVVTHQDQATKGDQKLETESKYDGFGREAEVDTFESTTGYIAVQVTYDALWRIASITNPYRQGDTVYSTTFGYDALNRLTTTTAPDSSVSSASYSGNQATVTDAAGSRRMSITDALGRLSSVNEDPNGLNYVTNYAYDVLNDLTSVSQGYCPDCLIRSFTYDSLGRLTQAANPESGTVKYAWDNVGNLGGRTDARNVTTSYSYDALNRITGSSYNDGTTPGTGYGYDTASPYGIGRLASVSNTASVAMNYGAYDPMGRVTSSNQQVLGQTYPFTYVYNVAGDLISETYPSGRVIVPSYDTADLPPFALPRLHTNRVTGFIVCE